MGHGTVTSLNNQPGTGLVWTSDVQGDGLRIFNAIPNGNTMTMIKSFPVPGSMKFGRPVFGDGRVYVTSSQGYIHGFGAPVNQPLNCSSPYDFGTGEVGSTSAPRTITCRANIGVTVSAVTLNGTDFAIAGVPALPATLAVGATLSFTATFKPTTVDLRIGTISIDTTNNAAGYSKKSSVRLTGTGRSSAALFKIDPASVPFTNAVVGGPPTTQTVLFQNLGQTALTISGIQYSQTSATGPFVAPTNSGAGSQVGPFTFSNLPTTIAAGGSATVTVSYNPTTAGTFTVYLVANSNGGPQTLVATGSAGPAPVTRVEFQTVDGAGWVTYQPGTPFSFGTVTENTARSLKMRVTNAGGANAVPLSLTVSKPPFGVPGVINAANQVDLAEGTILGPGESATASLFCSVPKSQWNVDPFTGTADWTLNTNDPGFGKQVIGFVCNAVSEQAPPLQANGLGLYRYLGCYKENNPGRQLATLLYGAQDNTNAKCIAACAAGNFNYCGTQYNRECWGGPNIPTLKVDEANCNYPCLGDVNQWCGGNGAGAGAGGAYISLFSSNATGGGTTPPPGGGGGGGTPSGPVTNPGTNGYSFLSCYTESTAGRALPNGLAIAPKTVANCLTSAKAQNYAYAGLEYGGECWAGNVFSAGAVPVVVSQCNMPCNGNTSEYCGAGSRLTVYQLGANTGPGATTTTASSTTTAPTGTGTGTSTSTSATPPSAVPTGPHIRPTIGPWTRQGCYTEGANGRALTLRSYADDAMTLESCANFCTGYTYFGAEYSREW